MVRRNIKTLLTNRNGPAPVRLVTQRTPDAPTGASAWSLVGGVAADDETSEHAARRLLAERVGLTDVELTCVHEWVQVGETNHEPALRSVWVADTVATVHDLDVATLQAAAFFVDVQLARLEVTDTTKLALCLTIPAVVPTVVSADRLEVVLVDATGNLPPATVLQRRYRTGRVLDVEPDGHLDRDTDPGMLDVATGTHLLATGQADPDLYRVAARRLGVAPARCAYVSHDRLALAAAAAADLVPIRVRTDVSEPNPQIHPEVEPWPLINGIDELDQILPT